MNAICKTCNHELSAILSPFESFKAQLKRLFTGFCSKRCARASFKISSKLLILTLGFSMVGCESLKRLPGLESPHSTPNPNPTAPIIDEITVSGTLFKDHASVYTAVKGRTLTVEVLRPGETTWVTLTQPDPYDAFDEYQLFTIPKEGVHFGDLAYKDANGLHLYTGTPSAPIGSKFRIHSIKNN